MSDLSGAIGVLAITCAVVGGMAYTTGKSNRDVERACAERDASGRHVLQRVVAVGEVSGEMRTIIDNHNLLIAKLCKR